MGKVYQQTFIDTYTKVAICKLYTEKTALVAADLLNDRVIPFFEEQGIPLLRMLTDRGTEFCSQDKGHPYELYLNIEDIEHTKTKVKHPQTNGICERFHKTILHEFYAIAFRKTLYTDIEQLQRDVDAWLKSYNTEREHQGKWCQRAVVYNGPLYQRAYGQTWQDSIHIAHEKTQHRFEKQNANN